MPTEKEYMLEEATAAVTYQPKLTAGRNINISEDNVISSSGGQGGSVVTVTPNQMSGNLIATVTVDSTSYNLYSPLPQVMTGATSEVRGEQGLVPAPSIGYQDYVLYGDGTWKDPDIPSIIANPSTSAIRDLTKISIDGIVYDISSGSAGSEVVECTQDEYDALPSSKLTDNKIYCISGTKELDSNYNYYKYGENDEIVVRVYHEGESDENIVWFFNGWNQTVLYETIPSSLALYAPDYDAGVILSANYPNGGTVQDGWIGFYQSTIRAWNQGKGSNVTGIEYGVVVVTNGAAEQLNPYEDDPYIWISSSIKKIIVNGTEYANTGGGGGSDVEANPSEEPTDILDSIKIDDTVYAIAGGGGTEEVTDIMLPQNNWYFKNESSMNVAWSSNEIVFTWDGGNYIGASAQRSIVIPAEIDKIRFKITTGTSYYSTYGALERFKVAVGLRATYDTSWVYPDPTYTSDWLALTSFATPNDVWEGELDTSSIDVDTYLYIMGHGWNMTINEVKTVKIEKNIEPNPEETPTEVLHTLGINSTVYSIPGALQPITLTAAQYEVLPSSEKMDGSKIYFVIDE